MSYELPSQASHSIAGVVGVGFFENDGIWPAGRRPHNGDEFFVTPALRLFSVCWLQAARLLLRMAGRGFSVDIDLLLIGPPMMRGLPMKPLDTAPHRPIDEIW